MRTFTAALVIGATFSPLTHASAQTFVEQAQKNPSAIYMSIKRSFVKDDKRNEARMAQYDKDNPPAANEQPIPIDVTYLDTCEDAEINRRFDDQGSKLVRRLGNHAQDVLQIKEALRKYPESIWMGDLVKYEQAQLALIIAGRSTAAANETFRRSLAKKADAYRRAHPRDVPQVKAKASECGAGEGKYKVKLVTEPEAFRIQYVSMTVFDYCEEAFSDADLREKCIRWNTVGGSSHRMIGTYKVRVFWTEDKSELFNVPLDEADEDDKKKTINGVVHYKIKGKIPG